MFGGDVAKHAADLLGTRVMSRTPLSGGDLSDISIVEFSNGRRVVVKTGSSPVTEAAMLRALAAAGVPVPAVLAADDTVLVISLLEDRGGFSAAETDLGHILRRLHDTCGPHYGWDRDYAFGRVVIENTQSGDWPAFWAQHRLLTAVPEVPSSIALKLETLALRLPDILPAHPKASLLHGDLWGGNVLCAGAKVSGLIDPACYYGDGEVDLAMLHLFGHTGPEFAVAYGPLAPGWQERRAIYTLWPALVHLRLFGSGYRGLVEGLLARFD